MQMMPGGQYLDFAFSPDGTQIYYLTSDYGGPNSTLVRIPLFGGKPQIILKNVFSPPAVSPDGKRIAVITGNAGLTILNENGELENTFESLIPQLYSGGVEFADVLVARRRTHRHLRKKR